VLWIGYLQWHFRTRGNVAPPEPVIRDFHNIECRDAVLAYDAVEPVRDPDGQPVTRWDGRTTKPHPVTGEEVPDEGARVPVVRYVNPRKAEWPEADFMVGNPPFIGARGCARPSATATPRPCARLARGARIRRLRHVLVAPRRHPRPRRAKIRRFGFITTNSLRQTFNRRVMNIASDDAYLLGVLSSRIHVTWALAAGGTLEDRPRYNKTRCFEPFPFPDAPEFSRARIRSLAEQLDAHRKRQQELVPNLTLTDMYNVLEKLRSGEPLDARDQRTHDQGLVSVLRVLHDDLDQAVAEAYGWPVNLTSEEILFKLVDLNVARAAEERAGNIRWLRPEFQQTAQTQTGIGVEAEEETVAAKPAAKSPWPATLPERVRAVRDNLLHMPAPASPEAIARRFAKARTPDVTAILETLAAIGQARLDSDGYRI
jgi:hypothetical protein